MRIILKNEELDLQTDTLVTFKKAQQLNGLQGQYSYSNNITLQNSSKNRRLLGINYLPNSKSKSMTMGFEVDVVLNGCIFLKRQKLKTQKETQDGIPAYIVFTDNLLIIRAKELLLDQINAGVSYTKTLDNFVALNEPVGSTELPYRTAPISAQDQSGFIVVEEVPILLNVRKLLLDIFDHLGYSVAGDILNDEHIGEYYTSPNVGVYGPDGTPRFDASKTAYDYILSFLETFNGFMEVSDSAKTVSVNLWKNIEVIKSQFVDYSNKYVNFTEYTSEGGLAKLNTLSYSDSPVFYNGFFNNNKSIVEKKEYLNSDFGAGNLRLFDDQDLEESGLLPLREVGEVSDPQTLNLFRFEDGLSQPKVYYEGVAYYPLAYKAFSPNILEIWERFHQAYTKNIAQPTTGLFRFRYDAIFLANFKMQEVFFIKQLSSYWLPLELAFTSRRDEVKIKSLMIEKTAVDTPVVFNQSTSLDFYGSFTIADIYALYSAQNTSPAATMQILNANLTKNNIYVNGVQVLAFPTTVDVSAGFTLLIENIEPENVISNSDISFTFTSQEGGTSLPGKINVAHNGRANFVSEFRSTPGVSVGYREENVPFMFRFLNFSSKITTPINIADTLAPLIGNTSDVGQAMADFKVLRFDRASNVKLDLTIASIGVDAYTYGVYKATTKARFILSINGAEKADIYSIGVTDPTGEGFRRAEDFNVARTYNFAVNANDEVSMYTYTEGKPASFHIPTRLDASVFMTDVVWKFSVTEQL